MAWLAWLFAILKGRELAKTVDAAGELVEQVGDVLHTEEPSQPLPYAAVEEQRRQMTAATTGAARVVPITPLPIAPRPGVSKIRDAKTPPARPPPRERKGPKI